MRATIRARSSEAAVVQRTRTKSGTCPMSEAGVRFGPPLHRVPADRRAVRRLGPLRRPPKTVCRTPASGLLPAGRVHPCPDPFSPRGCSIQLPDSAPDVRPFASRIAIATPKPGRRLQAPTAKIEAVHQSPVGWWGADYASVASGNPEASEFPRMVSEHIYLGGTPGRGTPRWLRHWNGARQRLSPVLRAHSPASGDYGTGGTPNAPAGPNC